jgi:hypothetical protein
VFRALQRVLTSALVLQQPAFDKEFFVECDALGLGFGVVPHQGTGPVVFFIKHIVARHTKLTSCECELIGLIQVVRH